MPLFDGWILLTTAADQRTVELAARDLEQVTSVDATRGVLGRSCSAYVPVSMGRAIEVSLSTSGLNVHEAVLDVVGWPESSSTKGVCGRIFDAREIVRELIEAGDAEAAARVLAHALERGTSDLLAAPSLELARALTALAGDVGALGIDVPTLDAWTAIERFHSPLEGVDLLERYAAMVSRVGAMVRAGRYAEAARTSAALVGLTDGQVPPDHPVVRVLTWNHAHALFYLDEFAAARALFERVREEFERTQGPTDPETLEAQMLAAECLVKLGKYEEALREYDELYGLQLGALPADDPDLHFTQNRIANVLRMMGDVSRAVEIEIGVLGALQRLLPEHDFRRISATEHLALTLSMLGEQERALPLMEEAVVAMERHLDANSYELQLARQNFAVLLKELGRPAEALPLEERALAVWSSTMPAHHHIRLMARTNYAITLSDLGRLEEARSLVEDVLSTMVELGLTRSRDGLLARLTLIKVLALQGDRVQILEHLTTLASDVERTVAQATALYAPREVMAAAAALEVHVAAVASAAVVLSAEASAPPAVADHMTRLAFRLIESVRALSWGSLRMPVMGNSVGIREEFELCRASLQDAASRLALLDPSERETFLALVGQRERAQRELLTLVAEQLGFEAVDGPQLAGRLGPHEAILTYRVLDLRVARPGPDGPRIEILPSVLGFLFRADGSVRMRHLGTPTSIMDAVAAVREGAGVSRDGARGLGVSGAAAPSTVAWTQAGDRLRTAVLDPLIPDGSQDFDRLYVVLDGPLHLVPLDALPRGEGCLGDEFEVVVLPSLGELVRVGPRPARHAAGLVALGAIDYGQPSHGHGHGSSEARSPGGIELSPAESPGSAGGTRPERFALLPATEQEVRAVEGAYRRAFGTDVQADVLTGPSATSERFVALAPRARFLHLATHGYFDDPETRGAQAVSRAAVAVERLAPMLLCRLAFAGANREADPDGRLHGVMTAEELATLDLSSCEFAVLSACETNVGVRSAGLGIHSLQAALHAAGVRTAVTSLWRVDDAATCKLMQELYANLWSSRMRPAEALWHAKQTLRRGGHPARDWAGWILSGDPGP